MDPLNIAEHHQQLCDTARELFARKNQDYAPTTPFSNFELPENLGVTTTQVAIFVRFLDKVTRMANLLEHDPLIKDESFQDTIIDGINYLVMLSLARSYREDDDH